MADWTKGKLIDYSSGEIIGSKLDPTTLNVPQPTSTTPQSNVINIGDVSTQMGYNFDASQFSGAEIGNVQQQLVDQGYFLGGGDNQGVDQQWGQKSSDAWAQYIKDTTGQAFPDQFSHLNVDKNDDPVSVESNTAAVSDSPIQIAANNEGVATNTPTPQAPTVVPDSTKDASQNFLSSALQGGVGGFLAGGPVGAALGIATSDFSKNLINKAIGTNFQVGEQEKNPADQEAKNIVDANAVTASGGKKEPSFAQQLGGAMKNFKAPSYSNFSL